MPTIAVEALQSTGMQHVSIVRTTHQNLVAYLHHLDAQTHGNRPHINWLRNALNGIIDGIHNSHYHNNQSTITAQLVIIH